MNSISPVKFAMDNWSKEQDVKVITDIMTVYGAINAGIRSIGGPKKILTQLKGKKELENDN
ncbi:hypothetical protein CROQUDRAFT_96937 [Cronartium quercuum f. sp. fusiforme G11]|uniref:DUF7143 domain-containing protein n=1 Tax=Cronartium quercuum f. sp. fusiforme G11 TaxID=708437 RepID=A0A9P6NC95_9BASI|nr:hypothetical protein CROQUDRAFT_96937 [Cronartium quercuum f. sp. fusiforme G11]